LKIRVSVISTVLFLYNSTGILSKPGDFPLSSKQTYGVENLNNNIISDEILDGEITIGDVYNVLNYHW
jgi:hypothetical protein